MNRYPAIKYLLVFSLSFFIVSGSNRAIINVPADQPSIQAGINAAVNGDIVLVSDGTYTGMDNRNLDFNGKIITVESSGGPDLCIIDCEGADGSAFYFSQGETPDARVVGFTIRNSQGMTGAGITCTGNSSPTIHDCIFFENSSYYGSGVFSEDSAPRIEACRFLQNSGSAIGITSMTLIRDEVQIVSCIFLNNTGDEGAAIRCEESVSPSIINCLFAGNTADGPGGAIAMFGTGGPKESDGSRFIPVISNCTFEGNASISGNGGRSILYGCFLPCCYGLYFLE